MQVTVNPRMVALARESRGWTQSELALRLNVKQGTLSKLEAGLIQITEESLHALAAALNFPTSFFVQTGEVHGTGTEAFHQMYRRRQALPSKLFKQIEANVNITRMNCARMLASVEWVDGPGIPKLRLEDFGGSPEQIARALRATWVLPSGPIQNVVKTIEDAGGYIVPFDFGTDQVDATSLRYQSMPPLFFVNKNLKGDRQRFTLAHELGHMVMHSVLPTPDMEKEADRFASEFLMPSSEIAPQLARLDLKRAAQLKPVWKVSMAALLYKARTLGKITESQYRYSVTRMSAAGYRTAEPPELDIAPEVPRFHRELIQVHIDRFGYTVDELAKALHVSVEHLALLHEIQVPTQTGLRLVARRA